MEGKENNEYTIKILFIGEPKVGKTCILSTYLSNKPLVVNETNSYKPSVGVNFSKKEIETNGNKIDLKLYDISGQERFSNLIPEYSRFVDGVFIVYDITQKQSFQEVPKHFNYLGIKSIPIILLGNKNDLEAEREISKDEGEKKAEEIQISFYETSATDKDSISKVFDDMIKKIIIQKIEKEKEGEKEEKKCDCCSLF